MKKLFLGILVLAVSHGAWAAVSQLFLEFKQRDAIVLSAEQTAVLNFIKLLDYNRQGIVELDILSPSTSFVFRDKNGDICFGDISENLLRCKNQLGITSFVYDGDAD